MALRGAAAQLQSSIADKTSRVTVVGLEHVGLVDGVAFAEAGFTRRVGAKRSMARLCKPFKPPVLLERPR